LNSTTRKYPSGCRLGEKTRQEETDHRISNSLAFLAAMLRFESREIASVAEARASLNHAAGRLRAMARLHRALAAQPDEREVALADRLQTLCADVSESNGLSIDVRSDDVPACAQQIAQFGIILNELAANAVKHGDQSGYPVVMTLTAESLPDGPLRFRIVDNGPGLPDDFDFETSTGLGMSIVTSTVAKLGGTITTLDDRRRAGFEIVLPPARAEESEDRMADSSPA